MLSIRETWVNKTAGHGIGREDNFTETRHATRGDLFRSLMAEYGRCVSRMYRDGKDGTRECGWVFEGIDRYEDTGETYIRETWVEVTDSPDGKAD